MRWLVRLLIVGILILVGWFVKPFFASAEKQVLDCHRELFDLAGKRYWTEAAAYLAEDYEDEWGNNAEQAVEGAREAFRGFLVLDLQWHTIEVKVDGDTATITGDVEISGSGAGLSQTVMNKVNNLKEPWVFTWRKDGWKPGDWRLIRVGNEQLKGVSPSNFF